MTSVDSDSDQGALEKKDAGGGGTTASLEEGTFAMLAGGPGQQLDPIGCRHYMKLRILSGSKGARATFEGALDSADPSEMDSDGSCGGEELPKPTGIEYPLKEVSSDNCGHHVYEGTAKWSDSGRVTRTLRITDARKATCGDKKARITLQESRALDGDSHVVETYYSVDPLH